MKRVGEVPRMKNKFKASMDRTEAIRQIREAVREYFAAHPRKKGAFYGSIADWIAARRSPSRVTEWRNAIMPKDEDFWDLATILVQADKEP